MTDYRKILRRAGAVIIAVGVIDIAFVLYSCAVYSGGSLNVDLTGLILIVVGCFVFRGGLRTTLWVSRLIAFLIALVAIVLAFVPILVPSDLLLLWAKLAPISALLDLLELMLVGAVSIWLYRQLTSRPVRAAMIEAGIKCATFWRKAAVGYWLGGMCGLLLVLWMAAFLYSDTADEARRRAAAEVGPGYKFYVTSIDISVSQRGPKQVQAAVTAYNDTEIRDIALEWSE